MKYKQIILVLFVLVLCNSVSAAPTTYDEDGQDVRTVLTSIFAFVYDIVIIFMLGACVLSGGFIIKDHFSSGTDGKSGSTGIKIAKGVILATFVLAGLPYVINMILGS